MAPEFVKVALKWSAIYIKNIAVLSLMAVLKFEGSFEGDLNHRDHCNHYWWKSANVICVFAKGGILCVNRLLVNVGQAGPNTPSVNVGQASLNTPSVGYVTCCLLLTTFSTGCTHRRSIPSRVLLWCLRWQHYDVHLPESDTWDLNLIILPWDDISCLSQHLTWEMEFTKYFESKF